MPTCCRLQVCCDPPAAALDLAEHLAAGEGTSSHVERGSYEDIAERIVNEFHLVPKTLAPEPGVNEIRAKDALERLDELNSTVIAELRCILRDLGYQIRIEKPEQPAPEPEG